MQDQISIQAIFLLGNVGKMESGNPMRLQLTYQDERVHISGYVEPGSQQFGLITVHVNLPSTHSAGKVEDRLTFGIPKTDDESQTMVYQWKGEVEYFRPGRWMGYVER
ncbi:MAG: hypothetical protein SF029_02330 [bacterium]|nr:hypothetical protein [bacterium]